MTKLDENDLVEYQMFSHMTNQLGPIATIFGAIYYIGIMLTCFFVAGCMLLGALGIL